MSVAARADAVESAGAPADASGKSLAGEATCLLYERHRQRIFAFCLSRLGDRQEADDAVQNTFLYAFGCLQRGVVPHSELAWLFKIASNVCRTRRRSLWRRRQLESTVDLDAVQDVLGRPDATHDELAELGAALAAMPVNQRRALLLREWQGLSYSEIGQALALSQSAVETLLFRARRSLARRLEQTHERVALALNASLVLKLIRRFWHAGGAARAATAVVAVTVAATAGGRPVGALEHRHRTSQPRVDSHLVAQPPAPQPRRQASAPPRGLRSHEVRATPPAAHARRPVRPHVLPAAAASPAATAPTAEVAPASEANPGRPGPGGAPVSAPAPSEARPQLSLPKVDAPVPAQLPTLPQLPSLPRLPEPPPLPGPDPSTLLPDTPTPALLDLPPIDLPPPPPVLPPEDTSILP
ncbi:MAG TPA: RNA polymerase sigma factor [Gaiellaceae bacterium]|jgi:RNA polymerase sigma-70 factor (ECF subfamily)